MARIARKGNTSRSGVVVTLTVTVAILAATALTVLGLGIADKAVAVFDASSWLWSSSKGELGRVNGITGKVDTRQKIKDSTGHDVEITQSDHYLIIRDVKTGKVSSLDLATLQINSQLDTTQGAGVSVVLHNETAFIIDSVQGALRQVDPLTLAPSGAALRFQPGLRSGGFDRDGKLWLALPSEGTVASVKAGAKGTGPSVEKTTRATDPKHDIFLSVLDKGVAVLDQTDARLVTVRDDEVKSIALPTRKPGAVADYTTGSDVPVTVADGRHVYVVNNEKIHDFDVPGSGSGIQAAVAWAGWFYIADPTLGDIYVTDGDGKLMDKLQIKANGGRLLLDVREDHLFINAPDGNDATVIDDHHNKKPVVKFPDGVLGGDPPPPPPPPPTPPVPPKPVPKVPSAPTSVVAVPSDSAATVTWGAAQENLSPITGYVIKGGPKDITVGGSVRTVSVPSLVNGTTYTFTVNAVNGVGAGPGKASNPVTPTRDVPDAPAKVDAVAQKDGTVKLTWPAPNGQGHKIAKYTVVANGKADKLPMGDATGTELVLTAVPASVTGGAQADAAKLQYGSQYSFEVTAVNDAGVVSKTASPPSATVVPFNKPDKLPKLDAVLTPKVKGSISVTWKAPVDNGRAIDHYVVTATGAKSGVKKQDVKGLTVDIAGFQDSETVKVAVFAVNEAGDGPPLEDTTKTIGVPDAPGTVNVSPVGSAKGTVHVTWSPPAKDNGDAVLKYVVDAGKGKQDVTGTSVDIGGFGDGATVTVEVTAANHAGQGLPSKGSGVTIRQPVITGLSDASPNWRTVQINFGVQDGGSPTTCWVDGAISGNGCGNLSIGVSNRPGTTYNYTVHARNAAGEVTASGSIRSADLTGKVDSQVGSVEVRTQPCYPNPNGSGDIGGCSKYGRPNGGHAGNVSPNERLQGTCKLSGTPISSVTMEYNRRSDVWIYLPQKGGYMPWAWLKLDGDDGSMNALPGC